jgi:hypothetical protein
VETNGLLTLLLDRDRLAVAGALAVRAHTTAELVDATELDQRTVLSAIGDLRSAGLVRAEADGSYVLDDAAVRAAARSASEIDLPMDPVIGYGMTDDERLVLARFFAGRVLVEIPSQRAKRLIVLQRLALEFDPGRRYTELEVNAVLGAFHRDWSALRRGLVDEGLFDREATAGANLYWRSGGRVADRPPGPQDRPRT